MKFKIDENLPDEAAAMLRAAGWDACTVRDEALQGKPDPSVAKACQSEKRALVTLDLDFANIRAYPPDQYAGLIVLRLAVQSAPGVLDALRRVLPLLSAEPLDGSLWIVENERIRIWRSKE